MKKNSEVYILLPAKSISTQTISLFKINYLGIFEEIINLKFDSVLRMCDM